MSRKKSGPLFFKPPPKSKPKPTNSGQMLEIAVDRFSDEGRGLAFHQGLPVFIAGALPGEKVRARVLTQRRDAIEAVLIEVLQQAPEREAARCALFGECGGCQLQMLPYPAQVAHKQRALERLLAPFVPRDWDAPLLAEPWAYRHRARLAVVRGNNGEPLLGFKAAHSHRVVAVPECPVLDARLQPLLQLLPQWLRQLQQWQRIEEVSIAVDAEGHLGFACAAKPALPVADRERLRALADAAGIACGDDARLRYAVPSQALQLLFAPQDFTQVNPQINDQLVARCLEWLAPQPQDTVADFFCGLGNFSFALAPHVRQVIGFESVAAMVGRARAYADAHGLRARFVEADLFADDVQLPGGIDKALLDPPRAGAKALCGQLAKMPLRSIVYVSCNPPTLARDVAALVEGGFIVERAALVDMFPQTGHSEAIVLLSRSG